MRSSRPRIETPVWWVPPWEQRSEGVAYLKSLIDMGLLEFVDAISVHYYVYHQKLAARGSETNRRRPKTDLDH